MGRRQHPDGGILRVLNIGGREVQPAQVHILETAVAQRLQALGCSTPPIYELQATDADLYYELFRQAIAGNPYAEVLVDRGLDTYRAPGTRLFITDDGRGGGALFDGTELGSLYSLGNTYPRASRALTEVRRQCGGEIIICRGSKLRALNETSGFVAIAETPGPPLANTFPGDNGLLSIMFHDPEALDDGVQPVLVATKDLGKTVVTHYADTLRTQGRRVAYDYLDALRADVPGHHSDPQVSPDLVAALRAATAGFGTAALPTPPLLSSTPTSVQSDTDAGLGSTVTAGELEA